MAPAARLLTHLRGRLVSVSARAASLRVSKHSCCLFVWPLPAAVVRVAVAVAVFHMTPTAILGVFTLASFSLA